LFIQYSRFLNQCEPHGSHSIPSNVVDVSIDYEEQSSPYVKYIFVLWMMRMKFWNHNLPAFLVRKRESLRINSL
jgi:hypothetical protein